MSVAPAVERVFYVGVDLGKVRDHPAVCVLQRQRVVSPGPFNPADPDATAPVYSYGILHLEQLPLHMPYPQISDRAVAVCEFAAAKGRVAELVVDLTGVGRPVYDYLRLRSELKRLGVRVVGVNYTGGSRVNDAGDQMFNVPKKDIVAGLVVMFQTGEIRISGRLEHAAVLQNELVNFQQKISAAGNASYGNDGQEAKHDDLVNAAGLAAWRARVRTAGHQDRPLL